MSGVYSFVIEQNSNFNRVFTCKNTDGSLTDLTNASATLIARTSPGVSPVLNLSAGQGLVLGGAAGTITMSLTDDTTSDYNFSTAKYTLKVNGDILLRGDITLHKDYSA